MSCRIVSDRHFRIFSVLTVLVTGWMAGCASVLPDVVYQSPLVRVYPVDDPSAPPLATDDRYLSGEDLASVDLDTVDVDVLDETGRMRLHRHVAVVHLVVSETMYAVDTDTKASEMRALLQKAAALLGGDAVVLLRSETQRDDETLPQAPASGVRGDAWPGSDDRSKEEWKDDWRESRTVSVRAAVIKYENGNA